MTTKTKPPILSMPRFKNVNPQVHKSAESDGKLIADFTIMDHGFQEDRYHTLKKKQQEYIETTLCYLITSLCEHLHKLTI